MNPESWVQILPLFLIAFRTQPLMSRNSSGHNDTPSLGLLRIHEWTDPAEKPAWSPKQHSHHFIPWPTAHTWPVGVSSSAPINSGLEFPVFKLEQLEMKQLPLKIGLEIQNTTDHTW